MEAVTSEQYSLSQSGNILTVELTGHFNEETVSRYQNDNKHIIDNIKHQPWATLVIFNGSSLFTPEAEEALVGITLERIKNNMVAIAVVLKQSYQADLQQMQLTRIYQSCNIKYHFFSDEKMANTWLCSLVKCTGSSN